MQNNLLNFSCNSTILVNLRINCKFTQFFASDVKVLLVIEEHNQHGGIYSALAELLLQSDLKIIIGNISKKSIKYLNKIYSKDCIILFCAGIKRQLGDNIETYSKNCQIINNFSKSLRSLSLNSLSLKKRSSSADFLASLSIRLL